MISIAVIGCGKWGQNHIRNFHDLPGTRLAACCDTDEHALGRVASKYPDVKLTRDCSEILSDPSIDGVVVATPANTHYSIARAALLAGKHVLVEKPFTLSSWEAEQLIAIAERNNRVLMVGHILDYHPALIQLKDYISSGELGKIYYVYANRTNLGRIRTDVSVMWDLAPHDVATLLFLLGRYPTHVAMKGQAFINKGIEDVIFLTLKFDDDIIANIHVSWLDPYKVRKTTIIGEKKMVVFDDGETNEKIKVYNKGVIKRPSASVADSAASAVLGATGCNGNGNGNGDSIETFAEFQYTFSYGDVYIPKIKMIEPLRAECAHFVECIREGKRPKTDGYNGLAVVRVLEKAEESLALDGQYIPIADSPSSGRGKGGFVARARSLWKELSLVRG